MVCVLLICFPYDTEIHGKYESYKTNFAPYDTEIHGKYESYKTNFAHLVCGSPGEIPLRSMQDMWWKNWDCNRLSYITLGLPCHVWFPQCSMLIHVHLQPMLVPDTVAGRTTWSMTLKREIHWCSAEGNTWNWKDGMNRRLENINMMRSFMIYSMTKKCTTNQHKATLQHNTRK